MSGFYSVVPFEGTLHLVRSTESMPLEGDDLIKVGELLDSGKSVEDIQQELSNVWGG